MLKSFANIFNIPELKRKVLFTLALLFVYRIGSKIPTPGIDSAALNSYFGSGAGGGGLLNVIDMFSGGAFLQMTVFALGIMPYISASIIIQLLTVVVPYLERLQKEGEHGRKKITQYTRYGTVLLSAIQAAGLAYWMQSIQSPEWGSVVAESGIVHRGMGFTLVTIITLTTGTAFIMWLGELISEYGIGNGISLIIMAGIVARLPSAINAVYRDLAITGNLNIVEFLFLILIMVGVVAGIIITTQGMRKIPIQHAKKIVGRRMMQGGSTYLPLRINTAGVIPIIFASSILIFPTTIIKFFGKGSSTGFWAAFGDFLSPYSRFNVLQLFPDSLHGIYLMKIFEAMNMYQFLYFVMIVFFCYFYTAVIFNPVDTADNLKKYGAFIPGLRPGKPTSDFIDRVLVRITLPGSIFLALVAILPQMVMVVMGLTDYVVTNFLGGTGLIIIVGVALDTMKQIESHLLMRHYDGFMKKGKLRGRRSF